MSEEPETYDILIEPGSEEIEEYEPQPAILHDNGLIIFDPIEFVATYDCHAAKIEDGYLMVLCRKTNRWRSVEPPPLKAAK